jgi:hypothetical protein
MGRVQTKQRPLNVAVLAVLLLVQLAPAALANQAEERGWTGSQPAAEATSSFCPVSAGIVHKNPNLWRVVHNEPNLCSTRTAYTGYGQEINRATQPAPASGPGFEWPLVTALGAMAIAAGILAAYRHRPQTTS